MPSSLRLSQTHSIKHPNKYIKSLLYDFKGWAFDEESALSHKGKWKEIFFQTFKKNLLHLEIGPGTGTHFAQLCGKYPKECFLAIELKYKPLIQTITKIRNSNYQNGKVIRYNAKFLEKLFTKKELNNIYIHFPDPWPKNKHKKHRLIDDSFVEKLYQAQKDQAFLELKTDDKAYFFESVEIIKKRGYNMIKYSENLYENHPEDPDFLKNLSQFELIFFNKNQPIYYSLFQKEEVLRENCNF